MKQFEVLKLQILGAAFLSVFLLSAPNSWAGKKPLRQLNLALAGEPPQLNSSKTTDAESSLILTHILEGLTRNSGDGGVVAGVAERWELRDRGADFYLRKNAKWSDGRPVTAADFVFAWRLAIDPKTASEYAFILYPIKNAELINQGKMPLESLGVRAVDDFTLRVELEKPCAYFLGLTSFTTYLPIREDFYLKRGDRYGADAKDLISNGPFVLTQWVHGASLRMDKNPYYWRADEVRLDRIEVPYMTTDSGAVFNFFKDKKIDLIGQIGKDELPLALKAGFRMKSFAEGSVWYTEFNFREGRATANKNLRKAIQAVFNPGEYISRVIAIPGTKPLNSLIPGWMLGKKLRFRKEYPLAPHRIDLVAAKHLIEAARRELGGKIPPLVYLCDDTPSASREAEYFQRVFKNQLGIDLKIDKQTFKQRLAKMLSGDFDMVAAGWSPDFADPMTFVELKASWNENNRGQWKNADYDRWIRAAQSTSDPQKRMDAMAEAEKVMREEVAVLPKYERVKIYVVQSHVKGVARKQIGADLDLTQASIETADAPGGSGTIGN